MPEPRTTSLTPEQERLVGLVIERAEQACRYALKHQDFTGQSANDEAVWTVAAQVCEVAIRPHVLAHIAEDVARHD